MEIISSCTISFAGGSHQGKANCYRVTNDVVSQDGQWKENKKRASQKMPLPTFYGQNGTEPLGFFHQMSVLGLFCSGLLQMGQIFGSLPGSNIRKRGALFGGKKKIFRPCQRNHPIRAIASNERIRKDENNRSACRGGRGTDKIFGNRIYTFPKAKSQDPSKLTGQLMPPDENDLLFPRF